MCNRVTGSYISFFFVCFLSLPSQSYAAHAWIISLLYRSYSSIETNKQKACVSVPWSWTWSWKEAALALQYFERSGLKVSEGLGMVMEMESGDSQIRTDKI